MDEINARVPNDVIGDVFFELAETTSSLAIVYSDCAERINMRKLKAFRPSCCIECGIAEQNQFSVAAALANEGFTVFALAYAPFATARVLDQVRVNLGYMQSPVTVIGLASGFGGADLGFTHVASEDIANMRAIPNIEVVSPADGRELRAAIIHAADERRPRYIRVAISGSGFEITPEDGRYRGKPYVLRHGEDVVILGCGSILSEALGCAEALEAEGITAMVVNMLKVKPLDASVLDRVVESKLVVTVEEHSVVGGLGGAVAEALSALPAHPPLLRLGVPDSYGKADYPENLIARYGLTARALASRIMLALGKG